MNSIQSSRIKVGELDIHYLFGGQGDPLIIIHGGSDGAKAWRKNITVLSKKYTVYVPDLPGFGLSQPSNNANYYIPEYVEFIDEFAYALGLKKFSLMGHSMGGGVALSYTLKRPQNINKLVLVSSLCLGREIAWWIRLMSPPFLSRSIGKAVMGGMRVVKWGATFFGPWDVVEPVSNASIRLGSCIANLTEQTINLLSQLPLIMVPVLVVWGAKDPVVPFTQAYAAAELIPDCKVKVFENAGHSVYRERLQDFSLLLTGFLG